MKPNLQQNLKSWMENNPVRDVVSQVKNRCLVHDGQRPKAFMQIGGVCLCVSLCIFALPQSAWALQSHGAPEGIYVHQMAHFFLMAALVYLRWDISRSSFSGSGWKLLKVFCVLFFLWNAMAFVGHAMTASMGAEDFYTEDGYWLSRMVGPLDMFKTVYYITKLDHFLLVPAGLFLVLSLRSFYLDSCREDENE